METVKFVCVDSNASEIWFLMRLNQPMGLMISSYRSRAHVLNVECYYHEKLIDPTDTPGSLGIRNLDQVMVYHL